MYLFIFECFSIDLEDFTLCAKIDEIIFLELI